MVIWKYKLNAFGRTELRLPKRAKYLSVGEQAGCAVMWFLVEPDADYEDRAFVMWGTGEAEVSFIGKYLGTCQIGTYVGHMFEVKTDGD